jgi:hypothetical protein
MTPTPPPPAPPTPVDDAMVTVVLDSDPPGADVLIAGSKIGTTPFEKKLKRGTKSQELTLRLAGHEDFVAKIDLAKDYENRKIKLAPISEGSADTDEVEVDPKPPVTTTPKTTTPKTTTPKTTTPKTTTPKVTTPKPPPPPKPKCQPPGPNVDPFSGVPVCKS